MMEANGSPASPPPPPETPNPLGARCIIAEEEPGIEPSDERAGLGVEVTGVPKPLRGEVAVTTEDEARPTTEDEAWLLAADEEEPSFANGTPALLPAFAAAEAEPLPRLKLDRSESRPPVLPAALLEEDEEEEEADDVAAGPDAW